MAPSSVRLKYRAADTPTFQFLESFARRRHSTLWRTKRDNVGGENQDDTASYLRIPQNDRVGTDTDSGTATADLLCWNRK